MGNNMKKAFKNFYVLISMLCYNKEGIVTENEEEMDYCVEKDIIIRSGLLTVDKSGHTIKIFNENSLVQLVILLKENEENWYKIIKPTKILVDDIEVKGRSLEDLLKFNIVIKKECKFLIFFCKNVVTLQ
jgi:hypothetical protein